jgi:glucose/arabinose dehydrogenase
VHLVIDRRRPFVAGLVLALVGALLGGCGGSSVSRSHSAASTTSPSVSGETGTPATTAPAAGPATSGTATSGAASTEPGSNGAAATGGATGGAVTTSPATCTLAAQSPPAGTISANFPTALAFAPDGRLFFTERGGTVRVVQGGQPKVFATVATVTTEAGGGYSERGLLGVAIDPGFTQNHYVYAFYSDPNRTQQHVIRWTDCAGVGTRATVLLTFPSGSDCCHKGGRLAFGPDGKLYVTLGDEHTAGGTVAQNTQDVRGKVLRYNTDGTVPTDNPFGAGDPVWVYGLRNPFGIAFSPGGQLAITNNGPTGEIPGGPGTGYDTVIFAAPRGAGYQWPGCYGYGHPNPGGSCAGLLPPDWSSETTTVVPTGATFVDAAGPAGYANHLVACSHTGGMLVFTPGAPHGNETAGPSTCLLDVKEGPNHALYFSSDTAIYRLG